MLEDKSSEKAFHVLRCCASERRPLNTPPTPRLSRGRNVLDVHCATRPSTPGTLLNERNWRKTKMHANPRSYARGRQQKRANWQQQGYIMAGEERYRELEASPVQLFPGAFIISLLIVREFREWSHEIKWQRYTGRSQRGELPAALWRTFNASCFFFFFFLIFY